MIIIQIVLDFTPSHASFFSLNMDFYLRPAAPQDLELVAGMIKELAIYEKMEHECNTTADILAQSMFPKDKSPLVHVFIAIHKPTEKPAGFCLYFYNFSTFTGRPGLYLEDLFVRAEYRGNGLGKLFFAELKRIAREQNCSRMEWVVLDWNKPARDFYSKLKAKEMTEWVICRLSGDTLK
jgi:GNAT superfamily N-acetyltransferase